MDSNCLAWLIRRHTIEMAHSGHSSHIASALSCADILSVLYTSFLKFDSSNPNWEERDYFIMSKGHAGSALYATLATVGFFDTSILLTHYQNGSLLSGHVSHKIPGIEFSTGSLGHGFPVACGYAYYFKSIKKNNHVVVLMGDGECDEGTTWESALLASTKELSNLVVIIDRNRQQGLGDTETILRLDNLKDKFVDFGWNAVEVNGHSHTEVLKALNTPMNNKPLVIVCNTVKGKGISFMENSLLWHYRFPHDGDEYENSIKELCTSKPKELTDPYSKGEKNA